MVRKRCASPHAYSPAPDAPPYSAAEPARVNTGFACAPFAGMQLAKLVENKLTDRTGFPAPP